jgi:hypothetical protein
MSPEEFYSSDIPLSGEGNMCKKGPVSLETSKYIYEDWLESKVVSPEQVETAVESLNSGVGSHKDPENAKDVFISIGF